jgi:hypothetical protein
MAIKVQGTGQDTVRKTGLQTPRLDKPDLDMVDEVYVDEFAAFTKRAMELAGYKANILEFKVGRHLIRRDQQPVSYGDPTGRELDEDGRVKKFGPKEVAPCWQILTANAEVLKSRGYEPVPAVKEDGTKGGPVIYGQLQLWMRPANMTLRAENRASLEKFAELQRVPTPEHPTTDKYVTPGAGGLVAI